LAFPPAAQIWQKMRKSLFVFQLCPSQQSFSLVLLSHENYRKSENFKSVGESDSRVVSKGNLSVLALSLYSSLPRLCRHLHHLTKCPFEAITCSCSVVVRAWGLILYRQRPGAW
jgi:hypothetical protein